ncbi:hypothetical protein T261_0111 [Streptomyces lydicus]|nr:hypothetical protein T261_0111 [Streptomyces lydicus]
MPELLKEAMRTPDHKSCTVGEHLKADNDYDWGVSQLAEPRNATPVRREPFSPTPAKRSDYAKHLSAHRYLQIGIEPGPRVSTGVRQAAMADCS